jgi:hypothetical protein
MDIVETDDVVYSGCVSQARTAAVLRSRKHSLQKRHRRSYSTGTHFCKQQDCENIPDIAAPERD